ncbi:hypothetical protein [Paenibacillus sp. Y412MC10]|uniref:hypothetical protein n=1 Tax=Geobacillus sp. (strain Y412MC10) TaxID=481743 RepID=UPI0011AB6824|nr:hypothetical protein [Paenibacillus sp. Y412MC10]
MITKYIGKVVEIIYEDEHGEITHRKVLVNSVKNQTIVGTCLKVAAPRKFRLDRILAWNPIDKLSVV